MDDLGWMDTCFMVPYALGQLFLGHFGDTMDLKIFIAVGVFPSIICLGIMTLLEFLDKFNLIVFCCLQALNGLGQSTGHTAFVAIIGNWFCKKEIGFFLGFWIGSTNLGDILGF